MPNRKRLLLVTFTLLLSLCSLAASNSSLNLRVNSVDTREQPDELVMKVYFTLADEKAGQVVSDVEVKKAEMTLKNTNETYPATVGHPDTPIYIALVLDSSGSMAGSSDQMHTAAIAALKNSPDQAFFSVVQFNEKIETLQDFTQNISAVEYAINQAKPQANKGTCLYDAAFTAIQSLQKAPVGRRALILFTDGRDETRDGKVCSQKKLAEVQALASQVDVRVPINTIGMSGGDQNINTSELGNLASATGGLSAFGSRENLNDLFNQIMTALRSQWLATANVYPHQGDQDATLKVMLKSGETLSSDFRFTANRAYQNPLPLNVGVSSWQYQSGKNNYLLILDVADQKQLLKTYKMTVWDRKRNEQVNAITFPAAAGETAQFMINTRGLTAQEEYEIRIQAIGADGKAIILGRDQNNVPVDYIAHPFIYDPDTVKVNIAITSVSIPRDMLVKLEVDNPPAVDHFEAWLIDEGTNQQVSSSIYKVKTLAADGSITLPLKGINSGKYTLRVHAMDDQNKILAEANSSGLVYEAPQLDFMKDVFAGLNANPILLILIAVIILGVVAFLIISSVMEKQSTGIPVLQRRIKSSSGKNALPINQPDSFEIPRARPAPPAAPERPGRYAPSTQETQMDSTALPPTRPNFSITAAKLIMVSQKDPAINGQVIRLTRPVLNIGRVEGDLVIADPSISRSHARLEYAAEQSSWTITDLNSKYGVKVNGRSIAPGQPNTLQAGMVVELSSNTRFEFQVE